METDQQTVGLELLFPMFGDDGPVTFVGRHVKILEVFVLVGAHAVLIPRLA